MVGMRGAHGDYAAASAQPPHLLEMDARRGSQRLQDEKSRAQSLEGESIAAKGAGSQRHRNKQSLEYILKTGLAGGLAGSAVWFPFSARIERHY